MSGNGFSWWNKVRLVWNVWCSRRLMRHHWIFQRCTIRTADLPITPGYYLEPISSLIATSTQIYSLFTYSGLSSHLFSCSEINATEQRMSLYKLMWNTFTETYFVRVRLLNDLSVLHYDYWLWMLVIYCKCIKFHRTIGSLPVFVTGSSKVPLVRYQEQLK